LKDTSDYSAQAELRGIFRSVKQTLQEILDGFSRIFVRYGENKTRSFGHEEYLEAPK